MRAALESRLNAMSPPLATAWPNDGYVPVATVPYQRVDLLFANPANTEMGQGYKEQGIFQITLRYPQGTGPNAADLRAKAIRDQFPRTLSLPNGGIVVKIIRTTAIGNGMQDGDRWSVPVKVFFAADII